MAEQNRNLSNYTLIEILHLSYLLRDSFEYCHAQIVVPEEAFEKRKEMANKMLAEGAFTERWFANHPKEEVRGYFDNLKNYFYNIYEQEGYVSFETHKVDPEKMMDFMEETIKLFQLVDDILFAFYNEYKKNNLVDPDIERCILASEDYYRVICNWLIFNEVLKNDANYKKVVKETKDKNGGQDAAPTYEINYNLNILKRLIGGFNYNKQKYAGDKIDIKTMMDASFEAFRALDGTLIKEKQDADPTTPLTMEDVQNITKEAVEGAANQCVQAIRLYEPIWKDTYAKVVEYMKENPLQQQAQA